MIRSMLGSINLAGTMCIARPPREVFSYLAQVEKTPQWLLPCVRVELRSPEPRGVGTQLHYVYRERGREHDMAGEVTAWEPDRWLAFRYVDKFHVLVLEFRLIPESGGVATRLEHRLGFEPHRLLATLLWPIFRLALLQRWPRNLTRLSGLLAALPDDSGRG